MYRIIGARGEGSNMNDVSARGAYTDASTRFFACSGAFFAHFRKEKEDPSRLINPFDVYEDFLTTPLLCTCALLLFVHNPSLSCLT